ncbi:uncharacterized protein LOC129358320 [Poeciliopsis prolifica]|uniref:uncharacterized protein LOC129358320 n=1 Tax=Poeciliopsis prolifica TaxID=188132 RepID=UPI002412F028|nr:uncharacterized protein LOC129358320 [Poeciliopsis prolifica]
MAKIQFFVILICSIHGFWTEGFPPLKLTANESEIMETASVTLTCEGQRSSRCFLYTINRGTNHEFSCNQTFTGTELLKMAKLSRPANVELKCCIPDQFGSCSQYSDMLSVNVQTLPAPELTVNPAVITEMDTVTLTCEAPSSVSVSMCHLYILVESRGFQRNSSCHQTLRGTELLEMANMANRRLPAELKVNCRYTAEPGQVLSQYGSLSSILIQDKPEKKKDFTTFIPSRISTGPTSRISTGPTSRISTGPTSRKESNNNLTHRFTVDKVFDKTSSSTPLPNLRILKILFVALTGLGSVLGVIFLFYAFVIRQRADLEGQIMQETKNDDPDNLYHTYNTIPDWPAGPN